jgi:hypothetical protein
MLQPAPMVDCREGKQIARSCLSGYHYQDAEWDKNLVGSMSFEVSIFSERRLRVPEGVPRRLDESSDEIGLQDWQFVLA